jgi:hypothetical protein
MYGPKTYYVEVHGFGRQLCDHYTAETEDEAREKAMERCGVSIRVKSVKPLPQNEPPYIERNVPDGNQPS